MYNNQSFGIGLSTLKRFCSFIKFSARAMETYYGGFLHQYIYQTFVQEGILYNNIIQIMFISRNEHNKNKVNNNIAGLK